LLLLELHSLDPLCLLPLILHHFELRFNLQVLLAHHLIHRILLVFLNFICGKVRERNSSILCHFLLTDEKSNRDSNHSNDEKNNPYGSSHCFLYSVWIWCISMHLCCSGVIVDSNQNQIIFIVESSVEIS